jgi:hypothetical protein
VSNQRDFTAGDTAKDFTATLTNGSTAANLTGSTVELHFDTPTGILTVTATFDAAASGTIRHVWADGELSDARVGVWEWEAEVTFSGGAKQTFPGGSFRVAAQLA